MNYIRFYQKKIFVCDLPLSHVLLADEQNYPWLLLVPRKLNASRIIDLCKEDQIQLLEELNLAQKIITENFQPDQIKVAAIGNKVPQLHVYAVARTSTDPAWPNTVWDHPKRVLYLLEEKKRVTAFFQDAFDRILHAIPQ